MRDTDADRVGLAEREAEAMTRQKLIRRIARNVDVLRSAHQRLADDIADFGRALELIEQADCRHTSVADTMPPICGLCGKILEAPDAA